MEKRKRYCNGIGCSLRSCCKRWLPDPPDTRLEWVPVSYSRKTNKCVYFDKKVKNENNQ